MCFGVLHYYEVWWQNMMSFLPRFLGRFCREDWSGMSRRDGRWQLTDESPWCFWQNLLNQTKLYQVFTYVYAGHDIISLCTGMTEHDASNDLHGRRGWYNIIPFFCEKSVTYSQVNEGSFPDRRFTSAWGSLFLFMTIFKISWPTLSIIVSSAMVKITYWLDSRFSSNIPKRLSSFCDGHR